MTTAAWELISSAKEFGRQMAKRNRKKIGGKKIFGYTFSERLVKRQCNILSHIPVNTFHQWDVVERIQLSSDFYLNTKSRKIKA
ncbi:MAG: hypothetical protein ACXU93_12250 [Thermodesulfobacteriota bacterium]